MLIMNGRSYAHVAAAIAIIFHRLNMRSVTFRRVLVGGICFAWAAMAPAYAATDKLLMTANLVQVPCTLNADITDKNYTLTTTYAEDIWDSKSGMQSNLTPVILTLSKCGLGQTGVAPQVKINGNIATATKGELPDNQSKFRFRDAGDAGGTSQQFFIAIARTASPAKWDATNIYGSGDVLAFTPAAAPGQTGDKAQVKFWLGMAWGSDFNSIRATARAGTVHATINLEMAYK